MIDPMKLALVDKSKPLTVKDAASGFTCAICGARQEPHTWRVSLPDRLGTACLGCASDKGFDVR